MSNSFLGNKKINKIIAPNNKEVKNIYFGDNTEPVYRKYFTITVNYLNAQNTWDTYTESFIRGTTVDLRGAPFTLLVNNPVIVTQDTERKVFTEWAEVYTGIIGTNFIIYSDVEITAQYKTQYYVEIDDTIHATANLSNNWYDTGTALTWTADTHYEIDGQTQVTVTINHSGLYTTHPTVKTYTITGNTLIPDVTIVDFETVNSGGYTTYGTRISKTYSDSVKYRVRFTDDVADQTLGNGQYKEVFINNEVVGRTYSNYVDQTLSLYGIVFLTTLDEEEPLWVYYENINEAILNGVNASIGTVVYSKKLTTITWDEYPDASTGIKRFIPSTQNSDWDGTSNFFTTYSSDPDTFAGLGSVYGYIYLEPGYLPPDGWTPATDYQTYETYYYYYLGVLIPTNTCGYLNGGTVKLAMPNLTPNPSLNPRTISFTGNDVIWEHNTMIAFDGDKITPSSDPSILPIAPVECGIICYVGQTTTIRWTNKAKPTTGISSSYWYYASLDMGATNPTITVSNDFTYTAKQTSGSPQTSWRCTASSERPLPSAILTNISTNDRPQLSNFSISNMQYGSTVYYALRHRCSSTNSNLPNTTVYFYLPSDNATGGNLETHSQYTIYGSVLLTTDYFDFDYYNSSQSSVIAKFKPDILTALYTNTYGHDFSTALPYTGNSNSYAIKNGTGILSSYFTSNGWTWDPASGQTTWTANVGAETGIYGFVLLDSSYIKPSGSDWTFMGSTNDGNSVYRVIWKYENNSDARYFPGGKTFIFGPFNAETGYAINFEKDTPAQLGKWYNNSTESYATAYAPETAVITHGSDLSTQVTVSCSGYFTRTYKLSDNLNSYELSTYTALNNQLSGINYGDSWTIYRGGTIKPIVNSYPKTCAVKITAWYDHYNTITSSTIKRIYYVKVEAVSGYSFLPIYYDYDYEYLRPNGGYHTYGDGTLTITEPGTYTITTAEMMTLVKEIYGRIYTNATPRQSGPKFTIRNASGEIGTGDGSSSSSPHIATIYASDASHWYTKTPVTLRTLTFASNEYGAWNDSNNYIVPDGATISASGNTITITSTGGNTITRTFTPNADTVLASHYYTVSGFTGTGTVSADTTITPQITSTKKDYAVKLNGKWLYYSGTNNWGVKPEAVSGYSFLQTRGDYYVNDYYNGTWTDRTGTISLPTADGNYTTFSAGYWTGVTSAGVHFKLYANGLSAPDGGGFSIPAHDSTNDTTIILYAINPGTWLHT